MREAFLKNLRIYSVGCHGNGHLGPIFLKNWSLARNKINLFKKQSVCLSQFERNKLYISIYKFNSIKLILSTLIKQYLSKFNSRYSTHLQSNLNHTFFIRNSSI